MIAIAVENLIKRYPRATLNAVDDVSFQVREGELFGLLGPNGAGKSTIIGALTTRIVPTSGTARIMNIDVVRDPIGIKQRVAVVPQYVNLDRSLRIREILTFHAAYHGVSRRHRERRADELLEEWGLTDHRFDKVAGCSGGIVQRVLIARALMHSPDVMFLDEPTNNLDPQSRRFLWESIERLNRRGLTILLTTHDMVEAERLCKRVAIIDRGRVLTDDSPAGMRKLVSDGNALELSIKLTSRNLALARLRLKDALCVLPGVTNVLEVTDTHDEATSNKVESACEGIADSSAPHSQSETVLFRIFANDPTALFGAATKAVISGDAEIIHSQVSRPSLEDVFIFLTGRSLR